MHESVNLGKLIRVNVRDAWTNEAGAFTPWLAQDENLQQLGEALNIPLGLQGQEQWVGTFRADIIARNMETDELVLIENQLEKTDHSHLGQIITYAAGLEANTVVWIAEKFTAEHRAALDWLNKNTTASLQFFAVQIEVWRIGNSAIAPKFEIVVTPNNWARAVTRSVQQREKRTRVSDDLVVSFIRAHPEMKRADVAARLGISERKVYGALAHPKIAIEATSDMQE